MTTRRTPRTIAVADHLWEALSAMSSEMGVDRDQLVNQAVFTLARLNGFLVTGRAGAATLPASAPEPVATPAPEPVAAPEPTPAPSRTDEHPIPVATAQVPVAPEPVEPARRPSQRLARTPEPTPAQREETPGPSDLQDPDEDPVRALAAERIREVNAEAERQVRVPPKSTPEPDFGEDDEPEHTRADDDEAPAPEPEPEPEPEEEPEPEPEPEPEEEPEPEPEPEEEPEPEPEPEPEEEPEPEPYEEAEPAPLSDEDEDELPPDAKTQARPAPTHRTPPPRAKSEVDLYLQVEGGEPVLVAVERFVMGRGKHCDLVLLSNRVSREHATIKRDGKQFLLEDLNSSNGTWMDQKRIAKRTLSDGDIFTLGNVRIRCDFGRPKA